MKKLFFGALTLVCATVFVACGEKTPGEPSLIGKWVSDTVVKNEDKGVASQLNIIEFKEDSTMTRDMKMSFSMEEKGMKMVLPFEVGYNAKISIADHKIICTGDSASFHFKMEKDSVKVTSEDPTTQALAEKMITSLVKNAENEFGGKIKEGAMTTDTISYSFEGEVLKMVSDGDTLVLRRAK